MAKKQKSPTVAEWAQLFSANCRHVFRRNSHYLFDSRRYVRIEDQLMRQLVLQMISAAYPSCASAALVDHVVETIAIQSAIQSEQSEPLRIDGQSVGNIAVFKNGILNIGELIYEELREPKRISRRP